MINSDIDNIIQVLRTKGSVVAIKTDTVFGLICNAFDKDAVSKIYSLKNREKTKPLAVFVKDIREVYKYVDESSVGQKTKSLMQKYWPGALTIIFKKKNNLLDDVINSVDSVGIRIPNDMRLLNILKNIDFPLAQTSCNISGEPEYMSSREVNDKFGDKIDLIVDGEVIGESKSSTVISVENDNIKVLRVGAISINEC